MATSTSHRIIYETDTGNVYFFDADGTGAGGAIVFARLATGSAMTAGEFSVV